MDTPKHHLLCLLLLITATTVSVSAAAVKERCHPHDKKVLLSIKQSFQNAYQFASWFPDRDCCREWYMVKCDLVTHRIISLTVFAGDSVNGTLPPEIGDLPYLQDLTFRKLPNLKGTIPSSITKLQYLTFAWFDYNSLSGPIPSFFHLLPNLAFLYLSFNRFSGSIPPELGLAPSLIDLDLSRNLLTGPIPDSFGYFKIGGKTPGRWGTLFSLTLSHNRLSGPIPRSLGNLGNVSFGRIDLSRNQLTGDASFLFGSVSLSLILSRNNLSFDFSTVEINSSVLTNVDLNHNQIYGSFPSTGMENVEFLNVSYNRLCGPIPNVGSLQSMDQTSFFHNKCLCGTPLLACKSLS